MMIGISKGLAFTKKTIPRVLPLHHFFVHSINKKNLPILIYQKNGLF